MSHIDVLGFRIADDAGNHGFDVLVDRDDAFEDGDVLSMVNTEAVIGQLEDGALITVDIIVEVTDHLFEFFAILTRGIDDALKWGWLLNLNKDASLFLFVSVEVVSFFVECVLKGVTNRYFVVFERCDYLCWLINSLIAFLFNRCFSGSLRRWVDVILDITETLDHK